jgi:two-component system chemotaxis response regulator CheY
MKILIIDDSKAMRLIVRRTLRQAGLGEHDVVEASCGEEGLEAVQRETPDLVLCDWNMPGLSGLDVLVALRQKSNPVKFGFVTSEGTAVMRQAAADAGALFLIAKPFTPEAFRDALAPVLA